MFKSYYYRIYKKYKEKSELEGKYYLLGSKTFLEKIESNSNIKEVYKLYKVWNDRSNISKELGEMLEELVSNQDFILGIHKTSLSDEQLTSVFTDGLINNGDAFSSAAISVHKYISPSKTITPITNMINALLIISSTYKFSNQSIICLLPRKLVDEELHLVAEGKGEVLYDIKKDTLYLRPDFLLGYIEQENNEYTYITKEEFLDEQKPTFN